jgi:hypothetical protein
MYESLISWSSKMELVKIDILLKWIWLLKFKQNNITVYWSKLYYNSKAFILPMY